MSWSESFTDLTVDDLADLEPRNAGTSEPASYEQFTAARDAIAMLIQTGAVGDPDTKRFSGSLTGHANPGHEPAAGWANDGVYISFSQSALPGVTHS